MCKYLFEPPLIGLTQNVCTFNNTIPSAVTAVENIMLN